MNKALSSYRPHDPGHDYYAPGVYLITIVVRNRERNHELLGSLNNNLKAAQPTNPVGEGLAR